MKLQIGTSEVRDVEGRLWADSVYPALEQELSKYQLRDIAHAICGRLRQAFEDANAGLPRTMAQTPVHYLLSLLEAACLYARPLASSVLALPPTPPFGANCLARARLFYV